MAGLYLYVPKTKIKDIVDCGLKLSEWCDREISLPGFAGQRKVIKALLNPRDDMARQKDPAYECLRLDVDLDYCRVGDGALYKMGLHEPRFMERYMDTLTPLKDYRFGTFRDPEVLVMTSVLHDRIEVTGKDLDVPILFESSEVLYLNNLLEKHDEIYQDSGNHLLYAFYLYLEAQGKVVKYEDRENENAVFFFKDSKEYAVLRIPKEDLI